MCTSQYAYSLNVTGKNIPVNQPFYRTSPICSSNCQQNINASAHLGKTNLGETTIVIQAFDIENNQGVFEIYIRQVKRKEDKIHEWGKQCNLSCHRPCWCALIFHCSYFFILKYIYFFCMCIRAYIPNTCLVIIELRKMHQIPSSWSSMKL